jgi:hypothetical protein
MSEHSLIVSFLEPSGPLCTYPEVALLLHITALEGQQHEYESYEIEESEMEA